MIIRATVGNTSPQIVPTEVLFSDETSALARGKARQIAPWRVESDWSSARAMGSKGEVVWLADFELCFDLR